MVINFKNKNVLITGSARGIGKKMAMRFAENDANVIIADITPETGNQTANDLIRAGYSAEYFEIDLSSVGQINNMMKVLVEKYDKVDILINNARAGTRSLLSDESDENWNLTINVSLKGPLFLSRAFIDSIRQSDNNYSIINISSVSAALVSNESAPYHLAKAGIENLTRYLAVSAGRKGVRVNAISPGFIVQDEHMDFFMSEENTDYRNLAKFCHPVNKVGSSDDVANAALFLSSDLAAFITGQVITIDGGLTIQDQWAIISNYNKSKIH